ncbi:MAG: type II secretion system F family protein [Planctomycetota bacterium]
MNTILVAEFGILPILLFVVFIAFAIGMWVLLDVVFNRKTRSESRLENMRDRALGKQETEKAETTTTGKFAELLEKASPQLGETLKPTNEKDVSKLKKKLDSAGFRSEKAVTLLYTLKTITALFGFVIGGGAVFLFNGFAWQTGMYTLLCAGFFFYAPDVIVGFIAKGRKEKIFLGLPDALDLMVVCVEAGLGMDQAMRKVAEELSTSHPVIATEFKQCNQQLQYGSTREVVLRELADRNDVEDLSTLSSILIQVDKFGTSVGTALRTQSDSMRTRRRQLAEEKAAKTAVKLIFPLVLFIFPGIFVVLVGPAAITMVNEMLPAFQK